MPRIHLALLPAALLFCGPVRAERSWTNGSPTDMAVMPSFTFEEDSGSLVFRIERDKAMVIQRSPLGLVTDRGDFSRGLGFVDMKGDMFEDPMAFPFGKRSAYVNRAMTMVISFVKDGVPFTVEALTHDDGLAFRYKVGGSGTMKILSEATSIAIHDVDIDYWGRRHLSTRDEAAPEGLKKLSGDLFSLPVLAYSKRYEYFLWIGQAGGYGDYVAPHARRRDIDIPYHAYPASQTLDFRFPFDQKEPVTVQLPWVSPWRVVLMSEFNIRMLVESSFLDALNPAPAPALQGAAWLRGGRVSCDLAAADSANPRPWIDFAAKAGWEYHLADPGWDARAQDVLGVTRYASDNKVGLIAWNGLKGLDKPLGLEYALSAYAHSGFRGLKLDSLGRDPAQGQRIDFEDTQAGLKLREEAARIAGEKGLLLAFRGGATLSGERRRWPHVMAAQGLERPAPEQDYIAPFLTNIGGPIDLSGPAAGTGKTQARALAEAVVFESGWQIFPGARERFPAGPAADFLKLLPTAWDDIRFLDGWPGSHVLLARRKGLDWFVGGITQGAREAKIALDFLAAGVEYEASVYREGIVGQTAFEQVSVKGGETLRIGLSAGGGFALRLRSLAPISIRTPAAAGAGRMPALRLIRGSNGGVTLRVLAGERALDLRGRVSK